MTFEGYVRVLLRTRQDIDFVSLCTFTCTTNLHCPIANKVFHSWDHGTMTCFHLLVFIRNIINNNKFSISILNNIFVTSYFLLDGASGHLYIHV
jgi:hypothetical protein